MPAIHKRWLTSSKGKLSKIDLVSILRKDDAWTLLPPEVRKTLYELLPPPRNGEEPPDIDVHPLKTLHKRSIEKGALKWQQHLKDGLESKTSLKKALLARQEHADGKYDHFKEQWREEEWPGYLKVVQSLPKEEAKDLGKVVHVEKSA